MSDVRATVVVEGGCSGPNRTTLLHLTWYARDPLAVGLLVTAEPAHPALPSGRWSVLRDMLRSGLDHPVGEGDVGLTPLRGRDRLRMRLRSNGRECTVDVPCAQLRGFLDATEAIVPAGTEGAAAVEAALARLRGPHVDRGKQA
jgi:hypothetical protein